VGEGKEGGSVRALDRFSPSRGVYHPLRSSGSFCGRVERSPPVPLRSFEAVGDVGRCYDQSLCVSFVTFLRILHPN
jgi:hypothetical protein